MSDIYARSMEMHRIYQGKLETTTKVAVNNKDDLSLAYSPGVAEPCRVIASNPEEANALTLKGRTIAVISDGSAVLGLGDIGPLASLPVMEGKSVLFKEFAGLDSFPIILDVHSVDEIVAAVKAIAPTFGGINLEDISSPKCFEIEERLKAELNIPVMHDDQHGTAIVVLAGMTNAMKVTDKKKEEVKIVLNGPGAAGTAVIKLLHMAGYTNIVACDSKWMLSRDRSDLDSYKESLLTFTNLENRSGTLSDALVGADVFIGLSVAGALKSEYIKTMNRDPIIFALANPTPEIMPEEAYAAGAKIVATGRSDYPNQVNNVLGFPGIFKGALRYGKNKITDEMKMKAAYALASHVTHPTAESIIPNPFDKSVVEVVAEAMK